MNNCYKKSTLDAYNISEQTLTINENLDFTNSVKTGVSIEYINGSSAITINRPGLYLVNFNAIGGGKGNVIVKLQENGEDVRGAVAGASSAATTDIVNLSFSALIDVAPSCNCIKNDSVLTVLNAGVDANYINANITVTKLC